MLNELLEYSYYLGTDPQNIPLRPEPVKEKKLTGIRRPLQVLARGFLEICVWEKLPPATSVAACKVFLYAWVSGQAHEDYSRLSLPTRITEECQKALAYNLLSYARQISSNDLSQYLQQKADDWYSPAYSAKALTKKNNFNQLSFDCVIADAFYLGPLQNQRLALKETGRKPFNIGGSDKERKVALAVVAQYLQLQQRIGKDPNREFIPIVQGEISNWINVRAKSAGKNSNQLAVATAIANVTVSETNEPLFEKITMENNMKLRVSPLWLAQQEAQLIPESDVAAYRQRGYYICTDTFFRSEKTK